MTGLAPTKPVQQEHWGVVVCRRVGGPPLRFNGWQLFKAQTQDKGTVLFVSLYARKVGGFTIACSRFVENDWQAHAFNVSDIASAVQQVEDYCQDISDQLSSLIDSNAVRPADTAASFAQRFRMAQDIQRFKQLCGQALAAWDAGQIPAFQTIHKEQAAL